MSSEQSAAVGPRSLEAQVYDLMADVHDGSTIAMGSLSAEPTALLAGVVRRARELSDVTLLSGMLFSDYSFLVDGPESITYRTWFMPGTLVGRALPAGKVSFLPMSWSQTIRWLESDVEIDIALLQVSPQDAAGRHSFGTSASYSAVIAKRARRVIAEVNAQMPRTLGASISTSQIDDVVEVDRPVPEFPLRSPDDVDRRIARSAAALVPEGAVLQIGVGTIPDAVLREVASNGVGGLRILSTLTEAFVDLARAGCLAEDGPSAVVGEILGTRKLYDFAAENKMVRMADGFKTHMPEVLSRFDQFISINSALSVDLYGQINTEYVNQAHMGGIGGSIDFMEAAQLRGNLSVIALRSTIRDGSVSRIVPRLDGATVSIPRYMTQIVVTEHGVADLRGRSELERAKALVDIADPAYRDELRAHLP